MANETMKTALTVSNSVFGLDQTLDILGGMERDFECASFCKRSPLYVFSEVGRGPPPQTCRRSVTSRVTYLSKCFFWANVIFALITLSGLVLALMITFDKRSDLVEPLLPHTHERR